MAQKQAYRTVLTDETVVNFVFGELRNKGIKTPDSYFHMLDQEPFRSEFNATPILHGRRKTPFESASSYVDGLRIEVFRLGDSYEQMTIDISRGPLSADGIERTLQEIPGEKVLISDVLQFEGKEGKEQPTIPFIVYRV